MNPPISFLKKGLHFLLFEAATPPITPICQVRLSVLTEFRFLTLG